MKPILKKIYRTIPWFIKDRLDFYRLFGRFPNVKNPKTFNEKVLFRKRNACINDALYPTLADKFLVREYVKSMIGTEYLIPLMASYDNSKDFACHMHEFSDFVLKPNHGAGMVKVVDGFISEKDRGAILRESSEWMKKDFSTISGEMHYKKIKRKLLVEKKIGDKGSVLTDYKIHLFKQKDDGFFFVLQLIDDRFKGDLSRTFYINNIDTPYSGSKKINADIIPCLELAILLSKKLMGNLEYARIDWYIDDEKLYFGEITLTPASGLGLGYGDELDNIMGGKWDLTLTNNINHGFTHNLSI